MCLTKDLVYQAEVTTKDDNDRKTYISMTATTFKDRYRNHKKSFDDNKYENETELSKHVWKLKLSKKQYKINGSILSRASSIKAGGNNCSFCLEEKLQIHICSGTGRFQDRGHSFSHLDLATGK